MKKGKQENDSQMINVEARKKTFQSWPFMSDCSCTPDKMAEAGFYSCGGNNEPDLARCYFCRKELVEIVLSLQTGCPDLSVFLLRTVGSPMTTLGRSMRAMPGEPVPTSIWARSPMS